MNRLAVLTSGGDAPGMNAAIRAVVRTGVAAGYEVLGVRHGYTGLIAGEFVRLGPREVGGILEKGGTILGTTRCLALKTAPGLDSALQQIYRQEIAGLVVIGGNGSQAGSHALSGRGVPVVGVASTIDNDLVGSDVSIGTTSAIDVALEAVDRLRVTAASHGRVFLVEVMGRDSGYIATQVGIASGAEVILVPEVPTSPQAVAQSILAAYERGKSHAIAIVAEGAGDDAESLASYFKTHQERLGFDLRVCRLGHVQRGGSPGVVDRLLATRLAAAAVEQLAAGGGGVLMGQLGGQVVATPFEQIVGRRKTQDRVLWSLAHTLAQ